VVLTASRLDVFADFQGWEVNAEDRRRFVCRADDVATRENRMTFTSFEFGRRTSNTVMTRIYDKTIQMVEAGADYWRDIWGSNFDPTQRVIRIEFEINRTGLVQFGVNSPFDAIEKAACIYKSIATEWISLRIPTADGTRSRWPVEPSWEQVQQATFTAEAFGIKRIYAGRKRGEMANLLPGARGYLSSVGAVAGVRTLDESIAVAARLIREAEANGTETFESRLSRKFARWETP
jgi:hypothetical protein